MSYSLLQISCHIRPAIKRRGIWKTWFVTSTNVCICIIHLRYSVTLFIASIDIMLHIYSNFWSFSLDASHITCLSPCLRINPPTKGQATHPVFYSISKPCHTISYIFSALCQPIFPCFILFTLIRIIFRPETCSWYFFCPKSFLSPFHFHQIHATQ